MNGDNNERLAEWYDPGYRQDIVIWPILWEHMRGGDWYPKHRFVEGDLMLGVRLHG